MKKVQPGWVLVFPLLLSLAAAQAQQLDTLQGIKTFVKVCNAYKQLPLQLEVTMRNSTNFITGREDTIVAKARFYLQQDGSYISFGEVEQVVTDSLMLLVSNDLKRMMVYNTTGRSVPSQLQQYIGFQFKDSSLLRIAEKYTVSLIPSGKKNAGIEVNSRSFLYHTSLPKETIRVEYDEASSLPSGIVQLKRSLLPIDAVSYRAFSQKPEWADKLVAGPDSSFYIIKEQSAEFVYENIAHVAGIQLPVKISDRIRQEVPGRYAPAKAYQDYQLTQNF